MPQTMGDLARERVRGILPEGALEATVLDPPLATNGMLRIEVDAQPGRPRVCPWQRGVDEAGAPIDPSPGDAALAFASNEGNVWVVVVWPQ
jgi:hypothetical protein